MERLYTLLLLIGLGTTVFGNEALETQKTVCIFGGSTSTGGGHPTTSPDLLWHAKAAKKFANLTGVDVKVLNFARGATNADFYATCFDRFKPKRCDLVLLEFAINGGNVEELAAIARQKSGAPVVLISQYSCRMATNGDEEAVQRGPGFSDFRSIARKEKLLHINMDSWTSLFYGNPCENNTRRVLFKKDAHHLSDEGHAVLGELVARRLAETHRFLFHKQRHHIRLTHKHGNDEIFCAASGELLGSPEYDIAKTFVSDGWVYDTDVPGRRDKACWLTTQPEATLSSIKAFETFSSVEIFVQFSNKLQGAIHAGCDKGEIGWVNTTWQQPWTLIQRHKFRNNGSFTCDGKLRLVAKNVGGTEDATVATKVCGVVVKK